MPELPEVETIARGVNERVKGDRIVEAWFGSHREPFKNPPARQVKGLVERRIESVHRTGKHIVLELGVQGDIRRAAGSAEIAAQWIVHLGMTGRLLVTTPEAEVAKHTHARLRLESGRELRFVDPRRFGRLEFRDLEKGDEFGGPGREPLTIDGEEFAKLFRGRKLAIKAALLNQTLLAGVGNIYADESLFRAGIRPRRRAGKLTRAELERLRKALKEVLDHAIRLGGSSVSDYVDAEGMKGFFQLEHNVYQRAGEPCRNCGSEVKRIVVAGRSTHYCARCQH
ncbi:bifunctional DNA-formamidopyrimidine glycosylase/DNA-(apurinic or apyrimidinic site) lyase [Occallatibacter savannae]|uniref:bifunctional DNA-formamidopyrimidine glycosylase/DNA-(apurinic or apyrimidinic site) lyase n=1 Tax=Occallatibacter savannae TaxID=1002691 RepID=UPI000D686A1B|nr:bifunctional DNA-formamidopyrimidine glycosylase/DNA-(apurinic or apyrimidinic site) lyase [Occallatibacter savannae]